MSKNTVYTQSILSMLFAATLAGCGGGGTTGPLLNPNPDVPAPAPNPGPSPAPTPSPAPAPAPTPTPAPAPATKPTGTKIGVVDSGFIVNHEQLSNNIIGTFDAKNSGSMDDSKNPHGTYVAQVIAGKNFGNYHNAQLLVGKAADKNNVLYSDGTAAAAIWAMDQGARIVNFSLGNMYRIQTDTYLQSIYKNAIQKDVALVTAAGNNYSNMAQNGNLSYLYNSSNLEWIFSPRNQDMLDHTVIVGALDQNNRLMSYSYFPGENTNIQNRFITAKVPVLVEGLNSTSTNQSLISFEGTSAAAPQVTAVLGKIIEKWPHLTAVQSTNILLDSADKSFTDQYQLNNCGTNKNVNCGSYYFGQGRLDETRALQPIGKLMVPQSINNKTVMVNLNETTLGLPASLATSLSTSGVTFAAFDNYLRDYQFNLKDMYAGAPTQPKSNLVNQWNTGKNTSNIQTANYNMKLGFDQTNQVANTSLKFSNEKMSFAFNQNSNNSLNEFTNLFNFSGSKNGFGLFDNQNNAKFGFQLSKDVEVAYGLTKSSQKGMDIAEKSLLGNTVSLQYQVNRDTKITTGLTNYKESNSLFGVNGRGAFAFSDSMNNAISFGSQTKLSGIDLFFNSQFMYGNAKSKSNALNVKNLYANEFTLGFKSNSLDNQEFMFLVKQPLSIQRANMQVTLPSGISADGVIQYANHNIALTSGKRETNYEFAYSNQIDKNQSLQVNAIYVNNEGGIANKKDYFVGLNYNLRY